jgi:hypothetical protein
MWQRLKLALQAREPPVSHGGIVGQAWRAHGVRQALLAKAIDALDIRRLDAALGRAAGELLARANRDDVIDAALVLLASDGDRLITAHPGDLASLARAADLDVELLKP